MSARSTTPAKRGGLGRLAEGLAPLQQLTRLVGSGLNDLRAIARTTQTLPEIAETLVQLRDGVAEMNAEVTRMRQGVDSLNEDVTAMVASLEPLDGHLAEVQRSLVPLQEEVSEMRAGVQRLDKKVEEVGRTMRPMRRVTHRFRRAPAETPQEDRA